VRVTGVRRCRRAGPTPARVARSGMQLESPGKSAAACWLGRRASRGPPADASPVRVLSRRRRRPFRVRLGVTGTRDRPVLPNQSADPGTAGPAYHTLARHRRPDSCDRRCRACGVRCRFSPSGASLEVFRPLQHSLAALALVSPGGRPGGRSRFGVTPRHPRLAGRTMPRNSPLRFCARLSSECDVEVLAVADERGWASGRIGTPQGASCR